MPLHEHYEPKSLPERERSTSGGPRRPIPYRLNVLDPEGNVVDQYHDYSRDLDEAIEHAKGLVENRELWEVNVWLADRYLAWVRCDWAGRRLTVERRSEGDPQVWNETLHYVA
jgi:hypothetical protein